MGKVFTITEGLENLGAMKTGGQGSVYKGRRIGEIITAIKLLPTPIYNESVDDKNFADFQNEVQKLKKVNESPNPNVVKILSSGVSDTGNFPFIEMEYIEGPELEDLIKPPHDPIFTIKEALKVADQLSNALAHCHKVEVRHGDIKSNNVKFNIHTGNYVLLDFGLAVMSDEQRRSSLRNAGAIEFMAPEQNEGQMLYQTDVYSFGVILFELLAGEVPFPLHDKGETARNSVRLSHMETPVPDLLALRRKSLPEIWSQIKKEHEMNVPDWIVSMIYKCLEKNPESRFANGMELNEYIVVNSTLAAKREEADAEQSKTLKADNESLVAERERLMQGIARSKQETGRYEREISELRTAVAQRDREIQTLRNAVPVQEAFHEPAQSNISETTRTYEPVKRSGVSKSAFITLLIFTIALAAFAAYSFFGNKATNTQQQSSVSGNVDTSNINTPGNEAQQKTSTTGINETNEKSNTLPANTTTTTTTEKPLTQQTKTKPVTPKNTRTDTSRERGDNQPAAAAVDNSNDQGGDDESNNNSIGHFKVRSIAYFYDEPDETTRREANINKWNNAILNAIDYQDGFIYVIYKNVKGQVSKGWLRKKDLIPVD